MNRGKCQHSVMAETTVKQCAFAFIVSDFQHVLGYPASFTSALVWVQYTFIRQTSQHHVPGFRPTVVTWRRSWHCRIWLFLRSLSNHATESCGGVGEGTSMCRFASVPTWWLHGPVNACATRYLVSSLQPEYSCCYRCLAVNLSQIETVFSC